MFTAKEKPLEQIQKPNTPCFHCGVECVTTAISKDDKTFCCEGCKLVYEILNENGLCDYYALQSHPGLSQIKGIRADKYAYLDDKAIANKLYTFTNGKHSIVKLYIPGIHCSSCMWLLEHMTKLNDGITESRLNFGAKELTIHFLESKISLRKIVELLATIGYEPYISLDANEEQKKSPASKKKIYKLGVAGFCFGNIMLMSFPEYLSSDLGIEHQYAQLFRYLNLALALPVFFYSASEFFSSAWAGLKQRMLNIDAPIVLALIITFGRSIYEIATNTGSGYLDSMTGIVFFMLIGRIVQERAYKSISFHRDYKSYFPIAVNVIKDGVAKPCALQELKEKDIVELHNGEIIPADAIVLDGVANIDYSFVTGESEPVNIIKGNIVYAGGKQTGEKLKLQLIKPVAGSYLTSLWNHYSFSKDKAEQNNKHSVIHKLSRYFTIILLSLATLTAMYWYVVNPANILPSVSAMLIVACPCALLLAASYTNGNILRLLSNNGLFLRDATVIEQLGNIDHIVFDKTGTLTAGSNQYSFSGHALNEQEKAVLYNIAVQSTHPYSKSLASHLGAYPKIELTSWNEIPGKGITASYNGDSIRIGSAFHTGVVPSEKDTAAVYIRYNDSVTAFHITPEFRDNIPNLIPKLAHNYQLSMLSGDNDRQRGVLTDIFGSRATLLFEQKPMDKLRYIELLQQSGKKVLMVGDGLNDAGALQQSNVGITLSDDINNFSPSCDAILDASKISKFSSLLRLANAAKHIINTAFVISILYNVVGLTISMQGLMSPMIAAILMPISTLSIVMISTGISSIVAKRHGLSLIG
ncbi:MAG: heavy metal translocating P-type ATPase metal-binding domain-containing protein [Bacteroidetes bacterium]|nr:heavy metal translocating P-type ATPase metal-binding domain-containing protein [Bacteroidota bacterium]